MIYPLLQERDNALQHKICIKMVQFGGVMHNISAK
jgi:hypothetical protein